MWWKVKRESNLDRQVLSLFISIRDRVTVRATCSITPEQDEQNKKIHRKTM